jgi:acyl-coenzyme A thioesterase PaaI-like protein
LCFGCGDEHPTGLHLRVVAGEGLTVTAELLVRETHQGSPGLAHGGIVAAALDEILGSLNWLIGVPAVTARLETEYRRPVPVDTLVHLSSEVTGVVGRKVYSRGRARLGSAKGPLAAEASAVFVQVPLEHFRRHGRQRDVDAARAHLAPGESRGYEVNP